MKDLRGENLYLIACCGRKLPGGSEFAWHRARMKPNRNLFPELDKSRQELVRFYSDLNEKEAFQVYTAPRGPGDRKQEKIRKAWAKNRALSSSPTMPAIRRYQGAVYKELGANAIDQLTTGSISNLLIVSALFGILHPKDLIPDYELMMKDKTANGVPVYRRWRTNFDYGDLSGLLRRYMSSLKEIYCFMSESTGYVPAITTLSNDFNVFAVNVTDGSSGRSTKAWGRAVRGCLESDSSSREEIAEIVRAEGCSLVQV